MIIVVTSLPLGPLCLRYHKRTHILLSRFHTHTQKPLPLHEPPLRAHRLRGVQPPPDDEHVRDAAEHSRLGQGGAGQSEEDQGEQGVQEEPDDVAAAAVAEGGRQMRERERDRQEGERLLDV